MHGTETKNKKKIKNKNRVDQKKWSGQMSVKGSPAGRSETTGGICERGRF